MLLCRSLLYAFALPIRFQSYRCLSSYCLLQHSVIAFMFMCYTKRSAILRFLSEIGVGGGGDELSLRFIVFLLNGLFCVLQ